MISMRFQIKCVGERAPHPGPLPIGSADSADAEREKRSPRFGKTSAGFCSVAIMIYKTVQRLFPLPRGEGQGEGKRGNHQSVSNFSKRYTKKL
jgi:hypothetical protein